MSRKDFFAVFFAFVVLILVGAGISVYMARASAPPEESLSPADEAVPYQVPEGNTITEGPVYAHIYYQGDVVSPDRLFLRVMAYPGAGWPLIEGGYAQTDVFCYVKLRNLSVPEACHDANKRYRPLEDTERERERWNGSMQYVWQVVSQNKTLQIKNYRLVGDVVEGDVYFRLGGMYHSLSISMVQDDYARFKADGVYWNWGSRNVEPVPIEPAKEE